MKSKLINTFKYIFFLGLGIFLVWWSMHQIPYDRWGEFKKALSTARYWLLIPVFLILVLSHLIRALRWRILMEPMGYHTSVPNTFFAVMVGYLANMAVPRLGEVLKCTILAKYEKVPAEKIIGTIVAERVFDGISLLVVFITALAVQFDVVIAGFEHLKSFMQPQQPQEGSNKLLIVGIVLLLALTVFVWALLTKRLATVFSKMKTLAAGVLEGLLSARKLKHKWLFVVYSISIWALYALGTWVGFYATAGTSSAGPAQAISCLAFASIGMILTPGGIGAYAFLLAKTLEFNGIPNEQGLANGTLQWFSQCFIVLIVGFLSLGLLPWYNKKVGKL